MCHAFLPNIGKQETEMLAELGVSSIDELFNDVPSKFQLKSPLNIPEGLSETEVIRHIEMLLAKNSDTIQLTSFLGGGVWSHLIPEVVRVIVERTEFLTAYTPYQPEISQGMLQALFEYQSLIAELVDLPIVNASMYDWASALGEAALMASRVTQRHKFLVPELMSPYRRKVLNTYTKPAQLKMKEIACDSVSGNIDLEQLKGLMDKDTAGVYIENPAYLGYLEVEVEAIAEIAHDGGAQLVVGVDPISLGVIRPPGSYGADIVIGEGQPLGSAVNFGGPLLGLFACRDDRHLLRQLPGRIIGMTSTSNGDRRGFVMTLQAREQHIRREKATSNICSNQALCAITAAIYLCLLGPSGLNQLGEQILQLRHYAESQLADIDGVRAPRFTAPHFKEFVLSLESGEGSTKTTFKIQDVLKRVQKQLVLGGIPLNRNFPKLGESALVCVTEVHTKEDIDQLVAALQHSLEVA
ncbi:MAG: aminomethyl-transferring glycine dehydrogenase subunit GcvPA [Promethearchaeota archaeon]